MLIQYKQATPDDISPVSKLAILLYDEHTFDEIYAECVELLKSENDAFFVAYDGNLEVGFSQASIRHDYVEGTHSSPVGYLEGIYVLPEYRLNGIANGLVAQAQSWAQSRGCREFASDTQLHNESSITFHKAIGFEEAERIVCFVKKL